MINNKPQLDQAEQAFFLQELGIVIGLDDVVRYDGPGPQHGLQGVVIGLSTGADNVCWVRLDTAPHATFNLELVTVLVPRPGTEGKRAKK